MKIVIISDIKGKSPGIIPYGLNLARTMQSEVDIVHVIDTRVNQGVATPYADSHTITPAEKLSFEEILNKEKGEIREALLQIISREGSKLNYPLKINLRIEETSITNELAGGSSGAGLALINKDPDGQLFLSRKEMIDVCRGFKGLALFVPSGLELTAFENVLLPSGFSEKERKAFKEISRFTSRFQPFINAVTINGNDKAISGKWKRDTLALFTGCEINFNVLQGNHQHETLISYANKINPDLILFAEQSKTLIETIFKKDLLEKLLDQTDIPILFYHVQNEKSS